MRLLEISVIGLLLLTAGAFAQTNISAGEVYGNWGTSGSPYLIQGDIIIPNDSTLTIEPGVLVEFQGYYSLDVQGRLLAVGDSSQNISFTVNDTTGFYNPDDTLGGWNGIRFIDTSPDNDTSKLFFCELHYGKAVDTIQPGNLGGAVFIRNFSKVIISNCVISYNSAGGSDSPSGGGLCLQFADIIITENEISHNTAVNGGGIQIWESDPVFTGNTIEFNTANEAGGGVWVGGESSPVFNNDIISDNSAVGNGGGIICWQMTNIVLNSVHLNNNTGYYGGAVFVTDCELQMYGCNLTDNSSAWIGGGINAYSCTININETTFERDTAYIFGGAMGIYFSELTLNNSNLTDNSSRILGGGIHSDNSTININNTVFERDTVGGRPDGGVGGGIFVWHCDLTIDDCEFINDSASSSGGAISSDSSSLIINNTTFTQNKAAVNGGAISFNNGSLELSNSNFSQNSSVWGGGIISNKSEIDLLDCLFTENTSEHGGAVSIGFSNLNINKVSFEQNASIWGGAISATNTSLTLDSCLFSQNTASGEAGAIECIVDTVNFSGAVSVQIANSEFSENSSTNLYGALEIRQENSDTSLCSVILNKNVFVSNSANSYSAVRFIGNINDIEVTNSIFANNFAASSTSIFSANRGAKVKVINSLFSKNYPRAVSLNINSRIDFMNCTFFGNNGVTSGALSLRNNAEAVLTNSVFWDNGNNIISLITVGGNGNIVTINYCDMQYGVDSVRVSDSLSVVNWGNGNIDSYPLFSDTLNNDFHLGYQSPCISAGADSLEIAGVWYYCPPTDIEGHPRPDPAGSTPDMGAYESEYPVGINNEIQIIPSVYAVYQNYPNPFNPYTKIKYQVPKTAYVELKVYNTLGCEIETLVDELKSPGYYEVGFDASHFSSGVYFYRLKSDKFTKVKKMILIK